MRTALDLQSKIISYASLAAWREALIQTGQRLVVTNGCFDLLHPGHVLYLQEARNHGDLLLLGLNSDQAVRELKGEGRPVNNEGDRATVVAALEAVSFVCIFPDVRATAFLGLAKPHIYVKGGDYTLETLNQEERRAVERDGGQIELIPFVPGKSTTSVLQRMRQ